MQSLLEKADPFRVSCFAFLWRHLQDCCAVARSASTAEAQSRPMHFVKAAEILIFCYCALGCHTSIKGGWARSKEGAGLNRWSYFSFIYRASPRLLSPFLLPLEGQKASRNTGRKWPLSITIVAFVTSYLLDPLENRGAFKKKNR